MSLTERIRRVVIGAPKDVKDPHAFHKLSLVALLAWVGLGADGLSSSAYGPEEAFRQLGKHTGLAVFLAAATAATVFIISSSYTQIIEEFPSGGGGYIVASKILGPRVGVVSGSALLVDYVLTITISIAAGTDALFDFLPKDWLDYKIYVAGVGIALLTVMNLRGVKESVKTIAPVFGVFVVSHAFALILILGGHAGDVGRVSTEVRSSVSHTVGLLGMFATLKLCMKAYSLGGGTYTGIEAVSNGVAILREPRVATAKRTMVLMAVSLAVTAGGILLAYLLTSTEHIEGQTMNGVLFEKVFGAYRVGGLPVGRGFVVVSLLSEGALLFVAAQAGFVDGPRVMANMATDSWLPHRFAALSERLTMRNGVLLMGGTAAAALLYTHEQVDSLVVLYSINVFITFSLSTLAMTVFWIRKRKTDPKWYTHLHRHIPAFVLCVIILVVTVTEKFTEGGWLTLVLTSGLTVLCFFVKRHYGKVVGAIRRLDKQLPGPEEGEAAMMLYGPAPTPAVGEPDPEAPVAVVFVGGYGGLGRRALLTLLRMFPDHFKGVVFVSVAVVDSDSFKGTSEIEALEARTEKNLKAYESFGRALGLPSASRYAVGTEVAVEGEHLGTALLEKYPKALVVAGQIIFEEDTSWNRALHNETAFLIQRRLQHVGVPMIVLPVQLDLRHDERKVARPLLPGRGPLSLRGTVPRVPELD